MSPSLTLVLPHFLYLLVGSSSLTTYVPESMLDASEILQALPSRCLQVFGLQKFTIQIFSLQAFRIQIFTKNTATSRTLKSYYISYLDMVKGWLLANVLLLKN